jgi:SAM-dependent methyltransferase
VRNWPPAVKALLIQCLCLPMSASLGVLAQPWLADSSAGLAVLALVQGMLAALVTRKIRLDSWWVPIQLLFPVCLVLALALRLPPTLFLLLFLASVLLYWSTYRTRVPYYPSTMPVWKAVAELLPAERPVRFIDIGSGFGGLVLHLAASSRTGSFQGIETAPLPWLVSWLRSVRTRAHFLFGDYNRLNFADYDVVFAYLSPAAMPSLWEKAHSEMRPGSLLLSLEFEIAGIAPSFAIRPDPNGPALYGWRI